MHQLDMYAETLLRHQREAAQADLQRRQRGRQALGDRRPRFCRAAIISLGRHMVIWGTRLQRRYDDFHTAPEIVLAPQNK